MMKKSDNHRDNPDPNKAGKKLRNKCNKEKNKGDKKKSTEKIIEEHQFETDVGELAEGNNKEYRKKLSELFGYPIKSRKIRNVIPEELYNRLVEEPMNRKLIIFEKYKVTNETWGTWIFDVASSVEKMSNLEELIKKNGSVKNFV